MVNRSSKRPTLQGMTGLQPCIFQQVSALRVTANSLQDIQNHDRALAELRLHAGAVALHVNGQPAAPHTGSASV